ncbi:putative transposase [Bacillus thermophilus]|uniref:Transposase n=1 Tax=Siminovitchia thermophila TaxID=1245522 RepID=A0ABS2R6M9_9BACI|nr:RNA-guided endonuclease TnpB family protein [Siminovitchia thermophila]MBM7715311.1 putative transposase [Siminovitchia thermophila]
MLKTFKYRLYPSQEEKEKIEQTLNDCRFLYNSALEQRIVAYRKHGVSLTYNKQQNELPQLKKEMPEYNKIHSQVLQNVLKRLDFSFQNFFRRVKNGEKPGFPRFQGRNRYDSFTYPQSGFSIEGDRLRLSKIGEVRIHLHRKMEGKVKTCTIIRKNGKYYVCFACEIEQVVHVTGKQVGVDVGIAHLAITSDGDFFDNPKHLRKSERQLKRLQRIVSRRKKGSNRRRKAVLLLARKHERIANQRKDTNHKVSRKLVDQYDLIVFEDLNIKGMVKNRRLSKAIHEVSWNQLIAFATYKAEYADKTVKVVNPRNTSQMCSNCGLIVPKKLSERLHRCPCGYTAHRDINAARNILKLGLEAG